MNLSVATAVLLLLPCQALAGSSWQLESDASASMTYDTNAFNLSDSQQDRVKAGASVDEANGRIRDMESVADFITTVSGGLGFSLPDAGFSLRPNFAYHRYSRNGEKSFPEFGIALEKSFEESSFDLELSYTLDGFKKNYLAGTTVGLGTSVHSDERVYERATYDEMSVDGVYEHTLWSQSRGAVRKVAGRIGAGYQRREFDHPFGNHDLASWDVGIGLATRLGRSIRLDVAYQFEKGDAPGHDEVVILDEGDVGLDLNGDLDSSDSNVALLSAVDRSRTAQSPSLKLKVDLSKRAEAWLGYEFTKFDYGSDEPLDFSYRDRTDRQHAIGAGVRWRFTKHWKATLGGEYTVRHSTKGASQLGDEDGTKSGAAVSAALSWDY